MAWTTIPPTSTDPDAPLTSYLAKAWTDNPIAIANGDAGAPPIQDAALSTNNTTAGRQWVAQRYAGTSLGYIGQVVMARYEAAGSGTNISYGQNVNGAELRPCNANGSNVGNPLTGIWECQGGATSGVTVTAVTLWKRKE